MPFYGETEEKMEIIKTNPMFWLAVSIAAFEIGRIINKKFKTPLLNPIITAIVIIIAFMKLTGFTAEDYASGGDIINMMLAPTTAALAYSIYKQIDVLKKYFVPVVVGCTAGAIASMASVYFLCHAFGLADELTAALIPKSVTTPIALEICNRFDGLQVVTIIAVMITGIFGAVAAPLLIKLFRIKHPVAAGTAIGACSHAVGTTKAITIGEIQGAMSGVAIGISGLISVVIAVFM